MWLQFLELAALVHSNCWWCRCGCPQFSLWNTPNKHIRVHASKRRWAMWESFWVSMINGIRASFGWRMERFKATWKSDVWTDSQAACGANDDPATLLDTRYLENPLALNSERVIWLEAIEIADPYYSIPKYAGECHFFRWPFAKFLLEKFGCLYQPIFFDWVLLWMTCQKGRKRPLGFR